MLQETRNGIYKVLDVMGIIVALDDEKDEDLREYIIDSLQFINFILEIEHYFDIEVPANVLIYDNIASLNGFGTIVEELMSEKQKSLISESVI